MTDPQPLLSALADPTRREVYERLTARGPATASQLADELPVSRQAIAKHLGVLGAAGLVERQPRGRQVVFSARVEPLGEVSRWIDGVGRDWESRLRKLKDSF